MFSVELPEQVLLKRSLPILIEAKKEQIAGADSACVCNAQAIVPSTGRAGHRGQTALSAFGVDLNKSATP